MILVLCTTYDNHLIMHYICTRFCKSIAKGFRVTDLNIRVDARVVTIVDGRTNGRKTGSLYHAMPEAGATKRKKDKLSVQQHLYIFLNIKLRLKWKLWVCY